VLYFLNYALAVYVFSRFISTDSAEIKKTRARIKQLGLEKKRLVEKVAVLKNKGSKKELKDIEKEIKNLVPKEKLSLFADLLNKL